jgi:hypothetical protein
MSLGIIQSKISHGNESRKFLICAALTFISLIFRYEILYAKNVDLLGKLKEVKKSPFFSTDVLRFGIFKICYKGFSEKF